MPAGGAKGPLPFDVTILDPKKRIQAYINNYQHDPTYNGFEAILMRNICVTSATSSPHTQEQASSTFELVVEREMCNPMDRMHGGAVATLADMATTMATAPVSKEGFWEFGGVSRTLSVTYLNPVHLGTTITIECVLRSIGRRLSVTQCNIRDKNTGRLLAMAEHGKSALEEQLGSSKNTRL